MGKLTALAVLTLYVLVTVSDSAATTWQKMNGPFGADVVALVVARNTNVIYAGTTGGVYKSQNGGSTWVAASSGLPATGVASLTVDPQNNNILYAGTVDGVYKTITGGDVWTPVTTGLPAARVQALTIDPTNTATLYAVLYGNQGPYGIYKSINGGTSWTPASTGLTYPGTTTLAAVSTVVISPSDSTVLYASGSGVYKSIDSGASWGTITGGVGSLSDTLALVVDPFNSEIVYAKTRAEGVLKSQNGGMSWASANYGLPAVYGTAMAVDPRNSDTLYIASSGGIFKSINAGLSWNLINRSHTDSSLNVITIGLDLHEVYAGTSVGVVKSDDGGTSWVSSSEGLNSATILSFAMSPSNNQILYAGTTNGFFKSEDGGRTWTHASSNQTFYNVTKIIISPNNSNFIYISCENGHLRSNDGGISWHEISSEFTSLVFDPVNVNIIYAQSADGTMHKSSDGGVSWNRLSEAQFIPLGVATSDNQVIYASDDISWAGIVTGSSLFKSVDGGASFERIAFLPMVGTGRLVFFAVDPTDPNILYCSWHSQHLSSYPLQKSVDGGITWNVIASYKQIILPYSIQINPKHNNHVYVLANSGLFKSTSGGVPWSSIPTTGLPTARKIVIGTDDSLYVGTGTGLFKLVLDADDDGVPDRIDNCPSLINFDQRNNDNDGEGDVCDLDDDNDSILDIDEIAKGTNQFAADTDADGTPDNLDPAPFDPAIGGGSSTPVPIMAGWWLFPGWLAAFGIFFTRYRTKRL